MVIENVFSPTPAVADPPVSFPGTAPESASQTTSVTLPPASETAPPAAEKVTAFRESPTLDPQDVIESWGLSWHLGCALVNIFYGDLAAASRHIERERRRLE